MNNKTKILYVEDEPFLGKIVKESLESRDFEVNMVADGLQAVPAFEQYKPDICVLDVMLPNKDGFTIDKEINALNSSIPIIYLTAKNQTQDILKGFQSGGNDYIKKPFSMEELIVRIDNILQLTNKHKEEKTVISDVISIGQFSFHVKKYTLESIDGNEKKLSHREAQLLTMLAKNFNTVTKRKNILLQIWGDDSFFNSRNLDVYIKRLRDYFKADQKVKIITLKGVGYHFMVE